MNLFELKFKQYLKEGYQYGYTIGDEDTFLGWKNEDDNVAMYFPEVKEFFDGVLSSYNRGGNPGDNQAIEDALTPSNMRSVIGDKETDRFLEYAKTVTEINEEIADIIESHTHFDTTGAESSVEFDADLSDEVKKDALEQLAAIFDSDFPEYGYLDGINLQLYNGFNGTEFKPYVRLDINFGEDEYVMNSDIESYKEDFTEIVKQVKDSVSNTLNASFY